MHEEIKSKFVGGVCVLPRVLFLVAGIFRWIMYAAARPFLGGEVCMYSFVNSSLFSRRDVVHFIRCLNAHKKPCANIGPGDEVILYPWGILMSSWGNEKAGGRRCMHSYQENAHVCGFLLFRLICLLLLYYFFARHSLP